MNCPKCDHRQSDANTECVKCGLIFAKYHSRIRSVPVDTAPNENRFSSSWHQLLFDTKADKSPFYVYGRLLCLVVLVIWGIRLITSPIESNYAGQSFLHLINLPFHEAGHIFFRPFGRFMTALGGTLGQLIMPLIRFSVLLLKTRDPFGASVTLW